MAANLHILKASGQLNRFEMQIKSTFNRTLEVISKKITLPDVDVVIDDDAESAIPETGVGGYAPAPNIVYIHINTKFKNIEDVLDFEIKSTLAHELHHCARWATRGYGKTLLEALISEGLADHFDMEINGGNPKPWSIAIQGDELEKMARVARTEFLNEHYNHSAWFFGSDNIPRWAGYSIGYAIVASYLKATNKKASELVNERAETFITY